MARVAVIGAGAMGLAAAYHALNLGHDVTVFEADKIAGGMAAHFDFDGLSIERFYHFVCKADRSTFELMNELGIGHTLKWRPTSMGYFIDGVHHAWGDPVSLLRFPKLSLASKIRYGAQMFLSTKRRDWSSLENRPAHEWFINGSGREAYEILWRRLLELKFFEFANDVSAAWIATRIKRVGTSRSSIMQEELGYIDGGSESLVKALVSAIERGGGKIRLATPVIEVVSKDDAVTGLRAGGEFISFDAVLSTMPTPFVSRMVPGLSQETKDSYDAIRNIGVVCVMLKLTKPVSRHFWLNINDPRIDIPGIVEFSNLRQLSGTIVYVPFYMPQTNAKFPRGDADFVNESVSYLKLLNPTLGDQDVLASHVGRLRYAQPVCEPGFLAKIPKVVTPIRGLQVADTCYYYPEDRGISESVRYGKLMAEAVTNAGVWGIENR